MDFAHNVIARTSPRRSATPPQKKKKTIRIDVTEVHFLPQQPVWNATSQTVPECHDATWAQWVQRHLFLSLISSYKAQVPTFPHCFLMWGLFWLIWMIHGKPTSDFFHLRYFMSLENTSKNASVKLQNQKTILKFGDFNPENWAPRTPSRV